MLIFIFLGNGINKVYFPVFVPVGVTGNILSFLVRQFLNNVITFEEFLLHKEFLNASLTAETSLGTLFDRIYPGNTALCHYGPCLFLCHT